MHSRSHLTEHYTTTNFVDAHYAIQA